MKNKLTDNILIRVTKEEKNQLKMLADLYSLGNLSAYVINRTLYADRKRVFEEDFELSKRNVKKEHRKVRAPDNAKG